jgi:hypothetical protein
LEFPGNPGAGGASKPAEDSAMRKLVWAGWTVGLLGMMAGRHAAGAAEAVAAAAAVGPEVLADGTIRAQRALLRPIHLNVPGGAGAKFEEAEWRAADGMFGWIQFLPAWKGTDVFSAPGRIFLLDASEKVREFYCNPGLPTPHLTFDGTYLWATFGFEDKTIFVFNQGGEIVTRVPVNKDIAPTSGGHIPMLAIGTGHTDAQGHRWAFISRHLSPPLVVDIKTLAVSVYPTKDLHNPDWFPRMAGPVDAYLSSGGVFYVADPEDHFEAFKLDPGTHRLQAIAPRRDGAGGLQSGSLALADGFLYYAGARCWQRRDMRTGVTEDLVTDRHALPGYLDGWPWKLAVSNVFGLVAWNGRKLHHLSVAPAAGPAK